MKADIASLLSTSFAFLFFSFLFFSFSWYTSLSLILNISKRATTVCLLSKGDSESYLAGDMDGIFYHSLFGGAD